MQNIIFIKKNNLNNKLKNKMINYLIKLIKFDLNSWVLVYLTFTLKP